MKLKTLLFKSSLIIAIMIGLVSCDSKSNDSKNIAEDRNDDRFDDRDNERDAQFMVDAAEFHMEKRSLAKLAQDKSVSNHVTELGSALESSNSKSQAELTALAKKKNVILPSTQTKDIKDSHEKLNDQSGNDFGKSYSDKMVSRHKNAIKFYEDAASDSEDAEVRKYAQNTLLTLRTDLEHAERCKEQCDKE